MCRHIKSHLAADNLHYTDNNSHLEDYHRLHEGQDDIAFSSTVVFYYMDRSFVSRPLGQFRYDPDFLKIWALYQGLYIFVQVVLAYFVFCVHSWTGRHSLLCVVYTFLDRSSLLTLCCVNILGQVVIAYFVLCVHSWTGRHCLLCVVCTFLDRSSLLTLCCVYTRRCRAPCRLCLGAPLSRVHTCE